MIEPDEKRRIIKRKYLTAELRIREIFNIGADELVLDLVYDKSNSELILTTLKNFDEDYGDK